MLLHACEGHVELPGQIGDRSISAPEANEDSAAGGGGDGKEGPVELRRILNHVVQYNPRVNNVNSRVPDWATAVGLTAARFGLRIEDPCGLRTNSNRRSTTKYGLRMDGAAMSAMAGIV